MNEVEGQTARRRERDTTQRLDYTVREHQSREIDYSAMAISLRGSSKRGMRDGRYRYIE